MNKVATLPTLLTEREAAARLRIHIATLQRIRRRGEVRFRRVGRSIRYVEDWLTEYIERESCQEMKSPANSAIIGSRNGQVRKNGTARGTSEPLPEIGAQDARVLALQTLRRQN